MSVAWFGEIKQRPSGFPSKGATDGPPRAYPRVHPPGRGDHHLVLSHRRRLPNPQSERATVRSPQTAFGFGGRNPCALPAVAGHRVRTLFLARGRSLFLSPIPRRSRSSSLLVSSEGTQVAALSGALEASHPARAGGRSRDLDRGLYAPCGVASASGLSVGGLRGGRLGAVGLFLRLRGQAPSALCHQPRSPLLRTHPGQRRGDRLDRRAARRGGFGGGDRSRVVRGLGLPERATRRRSGRM